MVPQTSASVGEEPRGGGGRRRDDLQRTTPPAPSSPVGEVNQSQPQTGLGPEGTLKTISFRGPPPARPGCPHPPCRTLHLAMGNLRGGLGGGGPSGRPCPVVPSPAPQFLTCTAAPGTARRLSPPTAGGHRLSLFFHPEADLGLKNPVLGRRRGGRGGTTPERYSCSRCILPPPKKQKIPKPPRTTLYPLLGGGERCCGSPDAPPPPLQGWGVGDVGLGGGGWVCVPPPPPLPRSTGGPRDARDGFPPAASLRGGNRKKQRGGPHHPPPTPPPPTAQFRLVGRFF